MKPQPALSSPITRLALIALALVGLAGCANLASPPDGPLALPPVSVLDALPTQASVAPIAPPALPPAPADAPAAPASAERVIPGPAVEPSTTASPATIEPIPPTRDLWDRIKAGRRIPELHDDWVDQRERYYSARPEYVARMVARGSRYLFHIVEEVERRGLPTELALLPFIESAFNPQAMSSAKAAGMWQFIPSTGRHFDLKQNLFRDDRRSVVASTQAALDYLTRLHGMFGDWHLALAAYNWGEGNVQRAIARNRRAGLPTDYVSLRMPRETRDYVPKLQAIENILSDPARFGLSVASLPNEPVFTSVALERDIDVDLAARLAGLSIDEFKALNPQMNKPVILAAGTPEILLPNDHVERFVQGIARHDGPLASWTAWTAPSTLRVADAARRVGMSEAQLREVNRIPPRMVVRAGSTLLVPRAAAKATDVPEHIADNAMIALAPDAPARRRISVKVRPGDTLATVARRHRVSVADLADWNRLARDARLRADQTLVVMAPGAGKASRRATATPQRAAAARPARPQARATAPTRPPARVAQR